MSKPNDPRAPLDPVISVLFEVLRETRPPGRPMNVVAMREEAEANAQFIGMGAPEPAWEDEIHIPGPRGPIRARVWGARPRIEIAPVFLYAHGGGWAMGSPETHAGVAKRLCVASDTTLVSLDYHLAPEHPYPAGLEDCCAAMRWLRAHAHEIGGDPARIVMGGDSAGGNLAMVTPLKMQHDGERGPDAVVSLCGTTRLAMESESHQTFGHDDLLLNTRDMLFFRDSYIPREHWEEPFVSPLNGDLSNYPPTCVVVGGIDPLHDDGVHFAERLREAGRDVQLIDYPGMPHVWMILPGVEQGPQAIGEVGEFVKRVTAR